MNDNNNISIGDEEVSFVQKSKFSGKIDEKDLLSHITQQLEINQKQMNQIIKIRLFDLKLRYPNVVIQENIVK